MGRRLLYPEKMESTFGEGTFVRIDEVLADAEARTDFVRIAVYKELAARASLSIAIRAFETNDTDFQTDRMGLPD